SAVSTQGTTTPSAPMSRTRLIRPPFSSATRTRTTVVLRTAARTCSTISFQSRWPCSASMTTQSRPRATAISVMLGDSSVTHRPYGGRSAASCWRNAVTAAVFMAQARGGSPFHATRERRLWELIGSRKRLNGGSLLAVSPSHGTMRGRNSKQRDCVCGPENRRLRYNHPPALRGRPNDCLGRGTKDDPGINSHITVGAPAAPDDGCRLLDGALRLGPG